MASKLEQQAFAILMKQLPGLYVPDNNEKLQILSLLNISKRFRDAFDALVLNVSSFEEIKRPSDFKLLEVKVTEKYHPNLPKGFFFGITENEEMLLKVFDGNYVLCLCSINPESEGYFLADWDTFQGLNMNKRIQYQINIRNK